MTPTEKTPKTVRVTFPEVDIMKIKRSLKPGEKLSEVLLKKYVEHNALISENKSLAEKARKASDDFASECARHDNTQIELRKSKSEIELLKTERKKMSQQIATLQADIFAKETFWGKIKNLFA